MKVNRRFLLSSIFFVIVVILALVLCYIFIWKIPSASEIFKKYQTSIVELKSQNVNRDDLTATFTFEFPNDNLHNCFKNKWEDIDQRFDFSDCKKVKLVL
jgi:regulatory protein YycI of two-component signal transduction system YycFG